MGEMKRAQAREERRQQETRRVYMSFFVRGGYWICGFLEPDLKTPVCRGRSFGSADKVRDLIAKTPTRLMLEDKQAVEMAIAEGRGAVWLELTAEQYGKLRG